MKHLLIILISILFVSSPVIGNSHKDETLFGWGEYPDYVWKGVGEKGTNPEYKGKFGIIAPYSKDFCKTCNRLRITSRGDLRLCLFGNTGISVRHLLQKDNQLNELKDLILKQMQFKKESHYLELGDTGSTKNLSKTGG